MAPGPARAYDTKCATPGFSPFYLYTQALVLEHDRRFAVCEATGGRPAFLRASGEVGTRKSAASRLTDVHVSGYGARLAVAFRGARGRRFVAIDLGRRRGRLIEAGATIGNFEVLSNGSVVYEVLDGGERGVFVDSIADGRTQLASKDDWAGGLAVAVPQSGKAVAYWVDDHGRAHARRVNSARKAEDGFSPSARASEPCLRKGWIVEYAKGTARFVRELEPGQELGSHDHYFVCDTRFGKLYPVPRGTTAFDYQAAGSFLYVYEAHDGPGLPDRAVYNLRTGERRVAIQPRDEEEVEAETLTGRGTLVFGDEIDDKHFEATEVDVTAVTFGGSRRNLFVDERPTRLDAEEVAYADGRVFWRVGRKAFTAPAP